MKKMGDLMVRLVFGAVIPIFMFLLFWWSSLLFTNQVTLILILSLCGLLVGLLIDYLITRFRKPTYFNASPGVLIGIYLFYSVCLCGFFMGVPVFHPILGAIAAYYWGRRLIFKHATKASLKQEIRRISWFTAVIMGLICLFSATVALTDPFTASNLEGMFHLSIDLTRPMLVGFILTGGLFLIGFQYWLTRITLIKTVELASVYGNESVHVH